jgi:hypothetical protein
LTGEHGEPDEPVIELANEFTEVVVELVRTRNGARLRISVPSSGRQILLCPLELEALTWQDHELFSRLLQTPHGPEDDGPEKDRPEDGAPGNDAPGNDNPGNDPHAAGPAPGSDAPAARPTTPGGG